MLPRQAVFFHTWPDIGRVALATTIIFTVLALRETIRSLLSRYLPVHHIVREAPRVVAWNGQLLEDRLQSTNVSADEVGAAVRKAGLRSLSEVQAVVLENGGESSAVARSNTPTNQSAFFGLHIPGRSLGVRIT